MSKTKDKTWEQLEIDMPELRNSHVAITGKLSRYTREQANQLILLLGGYPDSCINRKSRYLVVGRLSHTKAADGKTNKLRTAERYAKAGIGCGVQMISEQEFYRLLREAV